MKLPRPLDALRQYTFNVQGRYGGISALLIIPTTERHYWTRWGAERAAPNST